MTCRCPTCGGAITYNEEDAGGIEACPHCAARLTLPSTGSNVATRQAVRRGGLWTVARVLGVLIFIASFVWFLLLVSTVLMNRATANAWQVAAFASIPAVLAMMLGAAISALARKRAIGFVCSKCGRPVTKTAAACANCGAALG